MTKNIRILKHLVTFAGCIMVTTAHSIEIYKDVNDRREVNMDELLVAIKELYCNASLLRTDPYDTIVIPEDPTVWTNEQVFNTVLNLLNIQCNDFHVDKLYKTKQNPFHVKMAMRAIGYDTLFHWDNKQQMYYVYFLKF